MLNVMFSVAVLAILCVAMDYGIATFKDWVIANWKSKKEV